MSEEIKIRRKALLVFAMALLLIAVGVFYFLRQTPNVSAILQEQYNSIPTQAGKVAFLKQSSQLTRPVDAELLDLDSQIITCSTNIDTLLSSSPSFGGSCIAEGGILQNTTGLYLGGQCCGALLNTNEYHENLKKLQAYKNISDVPLDPFHTPIESAKKWINYDENTNLTLEQQSVFNQAIKLSKEGGPCCCRCWHYYVNEGIAKKMIINYNYTAKQIADYWNASDICG